MYHNPSKYYVPQQVQAEILGARETCAQKLHGRTPVQLRRHRGEAGNATTIHVRRIRRCTRAIRLYQEQQQTSSVYRALIVVRCYAATGSQPGVTETNLSEWTYPSTLVHIVCTATRQQQMAWREHSSTGTHGSGVTTQNHTQLSPCDFSLCVVCATTNEYSSIGKSSQNIPTPRQGSLHKGEACSPTAYTGVPLHVCTLVGGGGPPMNHLFYLLVLVRKVSLCPPSKSASRASKLFGTRPW